MKSQRPLNDRSAGQAMKGILIQLSRLFGVRVFAIVLAFAQTVALTRVFGLETFGQLSFALSISAIAVLILSVGLDQILTRDIARSGPDAVGRTRRWAVVWRTIFRILAPTVLLLSLAATVVFVTTDLGGVYAIPLIGVSVMAPFILARKYVEAILLGTKQVVRSLVGSQIAYPALMAVGAVAVWVLGAGTGALSATTVYVVAAAGSLVIALAVGRSTLKEIRAAGAGYPPEGEETSRTELVRSGFHFALISFGFVLGQHLSVLMTGVLAAPEDVSVVRVASRFAEIAGLVRAIAVLQYRPLLAEAYGRNEKAVLQKHSTTLAVIFTLTGIPITVGLWFFAEEAMGLFGAGFQEGAWPMRLYLLGVLATMLFGPGTLVLSMCDGEVRASHNLIAMLAIQFVLSLALIPPMGAMGAAVAQLCALAFLSLASALTAWRRLGIDPTILSVLRARLPKSR